jgi:hypothetical protein
MVMDKYLTFKSICRLSKPEIDGFYMVKCLTFDTLLTQSRRFFVYVLLLHEEILIPCELNAKAIEPLTKCDTKLLLGPLNDIVANKLDKNCFKCLSVH